MFATAVNCMDGRTQLPVIEYLKRKYGVDYVDDVTEAGPDRILHTRSHVVESIRRRVEISVAKHGSRVIAVVGHHDCAGNPVNRETHLKNIKDSVKRVATWFPGLTVVGLYLDGTWSAREIPLD
jgi:carbonic anhydrase